MVGRRQLNLYTDDAAELLLEGGYELGSSITNDRLRGMSESIYPFDEQLRHLPRISCLVARYGYQALPKSVHEH